MSFCRLAAAVFVLALIVGPAAAQVLDSPAKSPPAAIDPIVPKPTQEPTAPPPLKVAPVPEPGSIFLLTVTGAGAGWVAYWRRKWRAEPGEKGPIEQP